MLHLNAQGSTYLATCRGNQPAGSPAQPSPAPRSSPMPLSTPLYLTATPGVASVLFSQPAAPARSGVQVRREQCWTQSSYADAGAGAARAVEEETHLH